MARGTMVGDLMFDDESRVLSGSKQRDLFGKWVDRPSEVVLNSQLLLGDKSLSLSTTSHSGASPPAGRAWMTEIAGDFLTSNDEIEQHNLCHNSIIGILQDEDEDEDYRSRALSFAHVPKPLPVSPIKERTASSQRTPSQYLTPTIWTRHYHSVDRADLAARRNRHQPIIRPQSSELTPPPKGKRPPIKGWWKTEICKFWKEGSGCRNASNCRWAHGDDELRKLNQTTTNNDLNKTAISFTDTTTITQKAHILKFVWNSIRSFRKHLIQLDENLIIRDTITAKTTLSWTSLLHSLQEHNHNNTNKTDSPQLARGCDLCGSGARDVVRTMKLFTHSRLPNNRRDECSMRVCGICHSICDEKVTKMDLSVPTISQRDERSKLITWGLKIARLLQECECWQWKMIATNDDGRLSSFGEGASENSETLEEHSLMSVWKYSRQLNLRLYLLMRDYIESLPLALSAQLLSAEVYEGMSLLEWSAVAGNPTLFMVLVCVGFPIPKSCLPSNDQVLRDTPSSCCAYNDRSHPSGSEVSLDL